MSERGGPVGNKEQDDGGDGQGEHDPVAAVVTGGAGAGAYGEGDDADRYSGDGGEIRDERSSPGVRGQEQNGDGAPGEGKSANRLDDGGGKDARFAERSDSEAGVLYCAKHEQRGVGKHQGSE